MCEKYYKIPKEIHFWEINGYVRLSNQIRNTFKIIIRKYGIRKLSKNLKFDREAIYSIYTNPKNNRAHSISHLIKIANFLDIKLNFIEKEITHYGKSQSNMNKIHFPFFLDPLKLRAVTIHGDGSFFINNKKNSIQAEWYQKGNNIR